jgi:D-mannonate dehydratase
MFNVIVVSVLIVLIIHYTIDIFTKVEPPGVDPRVQKYKSIIESQVTLVSRAVEHSVPRETLVSQAKEQEQELEQYVQTLIYNGI